MSISLKIAEVAGQSQVVENIQNIIDNYSVGVGNYYVLEAGCGSCSYFKFPTTATICGIDISKEQLSKNNMLTEKILGDLQTYSTNRKYDMVICWNVLEHLENPEKALSNLLTWTKQDGIIIISVPNIFSVKGLITKFTPLWFHRWVYTHVLKFRNEPFPTYMRLTMSPNSILRIYNDQTIEYKEFLKYSLRKPYGYLYEVLVNLIKVISLGKLHGDHSQFYIVIRKRES